MKDAALTRLFVRFRDHRDGAALAALFDATARELLSVAAHLVREAADAEDLVQTTFTIAIERASTFRSDESVKGWLYGILWREAAKLRRRASRMPEPERLEPGASSDPAEDALARELPAVVMTVLASMPAPYREVLEPHLCEERSSQEIARSLGRAPGTVRVQIQRGLERLRERLSRQSLLGALPLGLPTRGLDALRHEVLRAAHVSPASATVLASGVAKAKAVGATYAVRPEAWVVAIACLVGCVLVGLSQRDEANRARVGDAQIASVTVEPSSLPGASPGSERMALAEGLGVAPSPHAGISEVVGRVIDERGQPVEGAHVIAERNRSIGSAPESTSTGADGGFEFGRLPAGSWRLRVEDPRLARMWPDTVNVPCGTREEPFLLHVHDPRRLRGIVVDEKGASVGHARITLAVERLPGSTSPVQGHLDETVAEVESDDAGRFVLERIRPGHADLVLEHPEFSRTLASVDVSDTEQTLILLRGLTLQGRVVRAGRGLAGVRVHVSQTRLSSLVLGDALVTTDAEGRFSASHLHSFRNEAGFIPTAFVSVEDEAWQSPRYVVNEESSGELPQVEVVAEPKNDSLVTLTHVVGSSREDTSGPPNVATGTATVRVLLPSDVDLPDGWIETSACVEVRGISGRAINIHRVEWMDSTRACSFVGLPEGRYRATLSSRESPNFMPKEFELREGELGTITLSSGRGSLRVLLRPGTIGAAAMRFTLQGRGRQFGPWGVTAHSSVADSGAVIFTGLIPGEYQLVGSMRSCRGVRMAVTIAEGEQEVVLDPPSGLIRGRVAGFRPVADDARGPILLRSNVDEGLGSEIRERVDVDDEGRFTCGMLPFGAYEVVAADSEGATYARSITLDAATPAVDVELKRSGGAATVEGKITLPAALRSDSSQLQSLEVRLVPIEGGSARFSSSRRGDAFLREGSYRFEHVAPGRYGVLLRSRGDGIAMTWKRAVDVGSADHCEGPTMEIMRGCSVRLQTDLKAGGASWSLSIPGGEVLPSDVFKRDLLGSEPLSIQLLSLAPGRYEVRLRLEDGQSFSQQFDIAAEERSKLVAVSGK